MKTPLKVSISLNGLLLIALGISLLRDRKPDPVPAEPPPLSELAPAPQPEITRPFRWTQLESTNDYRTYVANLRAVGCPEATIRAIVTADFETASTFERRQLQLSGESASPFSPDTTKQAIASVLAQATTPSHAEESEAASSTADVSHSRPASVRPAGQLVARASYPVVFQNAAQSDSSLSPNQKAAVRQLQQQFVDAVGGQNQNPEDPTYAARWQTAQQDADDALRAQLGNQAFLNYKMQHYYSNFQQVMLNAGDGPVTINPDALAK